MATSTPSRRSSSSSTASLTKAVPVSAYRTPPPPRIPLAPLESPVSMFTGATGSPISSTWSPNQEYRSAVVSPGAIDRVFPVRSAVSIDHTATPMVRTGSGDSFPNMRIPSEPGSVIPADTTRKQGKKASSTTPTDASGSVSTRRQSLSAAKRLPPTEGVPSRSSNNAAPLLATVNHSLFRSVLNDDAASMKSEGTSNVLSTTSETPSLRHEEGLVTARFKHIVTDGGHAVITGRDGETLQRCEDEPIHIPGAVQSFGLLLAITEQDGKFLVRVVSENSLRIIGYSPSQLFKLQNFLDIFTEEQADNLLDHVDFLRDETATDVVANGPEVFIISVRPPQHRTRKLWCAMHIPDSDIDMIICEFEIEDDEVNPLVPAGEGTPEPPEDTLGSNPTPEEFTESTVIASKPLRVLRSARKKRGEAAAMEVFNIMSQVQEQMANAPNLQFFLKVLVGVIKELSGFHRVMVYQFDQAWNGRVVSELVDPRATKDLYRGLNFPASDIPKQARELYKLNKVRMLYDREQETARLVCRTVEDLETPLDLTHSYLRAMSPIHLKYLANMAVRSSMSISINAFGELWGLIACHSYGSNGMRVSFPIRKMCRLVGDTASRNIERLSYASRLQARKLINTASSAANPSGYIVASSDDLLHLFNADVGALSIRDETKILGNTQSHLQEILAMVEYLRLRKLNAVITSQAIDIDFPDFKYAPGLQHLAGFLYVPLSHGGNDFIVFFRRGVSQEVKWAGNPYEKFVKEGTEGYLEPRKSFKTWSETIVGRCRDWTEEEVETASVLCLVYGKFIEVWRQKEAALQSSQLTRLLLANSAHEVRTPLNHIINYLEIAMEGTLDSDTRENLTRSHSASKSLVYVINDLLDLTKAESSQDLVVEESFDLVSVLRDATNPFKGDAKRKKIEYKVSLSPEIPKAVIGDQRRVRQVVSNLIANAIQHTTTGSVTVEAINVVITNANRLEVDIVVEDTGAGMSQIKVDALFRELEEVSLELGTVENVVLNPNPLGTKPTEEVTLGLGLAVVARTIRTMNGQLRLKTEEGKGSRFIIQLSFIVDSHLGGPKTLERSASSQSTTSSPVKVTGTNPTLGEVTLVNRSPLPRTDSSTRGMLRRTSADSVASLKSQKSGRSQTSLHSNASQRSDADRLIDAIQEPLRLYDESNEARPESRSKYSHSPIHSRGLISEFAAELSAVNAPQRSKSISSTRDVKKAFLRKPGEERIVDSAVPMKAVRIPEEGMEAPTERGKMGGRVMFDESVKFTQSPVPQPKRSSSGGPYHVLVAEDDPINSKIMQKRLEKMGHSVRMTVNGEECASAHGEEASSFDAVLMDLQMPIVDGFSSTKMIRSFEKTRPGSCLSSCALRNGRIPIFAVSASLLEKQRDKYVETGFDGWILKPVDFKRLDRLLKGIVDGEIRDSCGYEPGKWEQGGWFSRTTDLKDMFDVNTDPSGQKPTAEAEKEVNDGRWGDPAAVDRSTIPLLHERAETL